MKPKCKLSTGGTLPSSHKQLPICLICLRKITAVDTNFLNENGHSLAIPFQNINGEIDHDLYKRFLYFCKRYLKLKNADRFIEAYFKSAESNSPQFCDSCQQLLGYLLDVYGELNGLKVRLLSKVKELGEIVTHSKKAVSNKLVVGLMRKLSTQLNVSNYLLVDQLRRKLTEKCSTKAQKILPIIVLKRHVPDKTNEKALVSLIILFSLRCGWDLQKISDSYLAATIQNATSKKITEKSNNNDCKLFMNNDVPDEALSIPDDDTPLRRTRSRAKRKTSSSSRASTRFQVSFPSVQDDTESEFVIPKEESAEQYHLTYEHIIEDDGNHFDPEWVPSGGDDDDNEPDYEPSQFPKANAFKADDDECETTQTATPTTTIKRKRRRRNGSSPPRKREPKPKLPKKEPFSDPSLRCKECNIKFKTRILFCDHVAMNHDEEFETPFECQTCQRPHDGFQQLRDHLQEAHEDPNNKPYFCRFCDKSYSTQQFTDIHLKINHYFLYQHLFCDDDECQEEFKCAKDQNDHLLTHLTPEQTPEGNIFICQKCGRGFLNKYRLQLHDLVHWPKDFDGTFKCNSCHAFYRNTSVLMSHHNRVHMGENKLTLHRCEAKVCLLYEITKKELDTHKSRHELTKEISLARQIFPPKNRGKDSRVEGGGIEPKFIIDKMGRRRPVKKRRLPTICEECGLECVSRSRLNRHKFVHGEPQFTCPVCQKKYRRPDHLDIHINRIHSKINLLICEVCGKACPTKAELKYHVAEHEKRYQCSFCSMRFARRTILTGHERTHTGEKLKCEWCPVSLACLYNIKKHVRKCHPEEYKIHYSDGARTQYRYKIMKDNANAEAAVREKERREKQSMTLMEKARQEESQASPSNVGDQINVNEVPRSENLVYEGDM